MAAQRQAARGRWENTEGPPEPMSSRGPQAWPLVPVLSPPGIRRLCCWFPKLLAFGTASLSPPPADSFQELRPRCHWALSRCRQSACKAFRASHCLSDRAEDTELFQRGSHCYWQAGSPGRGCPPPGQAWGEDAGHGALGWLLAGVGRARTERVFTPPPNSCQRLTSGNPCGPGPVLGTVGAQRQEVMAPAFQELLSCRLQQDISHRKTEHKGVYQPGIFQLQ